MILQHIYQQHNTVGIKNRMCFASHDIAELRHSSEYMLLTLISPKFKRSRERDHECTPILHSFNVYYGSTLYVQSVNQIGHGAKAYTALAQLRAVKMNQFLLLC